MNDARAIAGTYADLKFIKTRSVAQIVVEVPIEQADKFLEMFGAPQPGKEIPVALARLNASVVQGRKDSADIKVGADAGSTPAGRSKVAFKDMPLAQQAGIRCADPKFKAWLNLGAETAEEFVRRHCAVASRAELATNHEAANRWRALNGQFEAYQTDQIYADTRR